jgi:hypothetical protein
MGSDDPSERVRRSGTILSDASGLGVVARINPVITRSRQMGGDGDGVRRMLTNPG